MNAPQAEKELGERLRPSLRVLGFDQVAPLDFVRATPVGSQTLRFGCRLDDNGSCRFSGTAGIILREVEDLLARAGKARTALTPTIMMPLHLLRDERTHFEWTMQSLDQAPAIAAAIKAEIEAGAIPFLERYSDIEAVQRALSHDAPPWFVMSPEQRESTLAAIEYLGGSKEAAIRRLDQALAEREAELPKRRRELEKLREYLLRAGAS